jgi:hypothetical protein
MRSFVRVLLLCISDVWVQYVNSAQFDIEYMRTVIGNARSVRHAYGVKREIDANPQSVRLKLDCDGVWPDARSFYSRESAAGEHCVLKCCVVKVGIDSGSVLLALMISGVFVAFASRWLLQK